MKFFSLPCIHHHRSKRSSWDIRECREKFGLHLVLVESMKGSRTSLKSPHMTMGMDLKGWSLVKVDLKKDYW